MSQPLNLYHYTFHVDYSSGLKITVFDNLDPENEFVVRAYTKKSKIQSKLKWSHNSAGGSYIEEETINNEDFLIQWGTHVIKSCIYKKKIRSLV